MGNAIGNAIEDLSTQRWGTRHARPDYVTWDEYFMAIAILSPQMTGDSSKQGVCVTDDQKRIVSVGLDGIPEGYMWRPDALLALQKETENDADAAYYIGRHAEVNAIIANNKDNLLNCTMYVPSFPCCSCAKMIVQSRITELVYLWDKDEKSAGTIAAKLMFDAANINFRKLKPKRREITLDFAETV